jgi:hypothetical protein
MVVIAAILRGIMKNQVLEDLLLRLISSNLSGQESVTISEEEILSLCNSFVKLQEELEELNDQLNPKQECEHGFYDCAHCNESYTSFMPAQ